MNPLQKIKDWAWVALAVVLQIPLPWEGTAKKKRGTHKNKTPRDSRREGP